MGCNCQVRPILKDNLESPCQVELQQSCDIRLTRLLGQSDVQGGVAANGADWFPIAEDGCK